MSTNQFPLKEAHEGLSIKGKFDVYLLCTFWKKLISIIETHRNSCGFTALVRTLSCLDSLEKNTAAAQMWCSHQFGCLADQKLTLPAMQ